MWQDARQVGIPTSRDGSFGDNRRLAFFSRTDAFPGADAVFGHTQYGLAVDLQGGRAVETDRHLMSGTGYALP